MKPFTLTPSPRILLVLTETAMKPIDALCELVDNSIDSFLLNKENGAGNSNRISIQLPTTTQLNNRPDETYLRVVDNGPGMTAARAQAALTAAYSDKERYGGSLGLFGVGLNIATCKLARKTRLITATKESEKALVVDVDLDVLMAQKNFQVQPFNAPKSDYFKESDSGTIIELSRRWQEGSTNYNFPMRLTNRRQVTESIGRRYATYLRADSNLKIDLFVGDVKCEPFEHCVWGENRSIMRGTKEIKAMEKFDRVVKSTKRCFECASMIKDGKCISDESHSGTTAVDEKVKGWIGVQRFDDQSHYGIDLIRNGRAIKVLEQSAFFTFTNEDGQQTKDYPIDSPYGRIVGEINLDHVPVNFIKSDFDRSTPEWERAIEFIRGNSSLQARQPGADENDSPLMRIYTGFRRVRNCGPKELYMVERNAEGKLSRISREAERELFERFNKREPGYFDDAKWFENVNLPDREDDYIDCPNSECDGENRPWDEVCRLCGELLKSKSCIKCSELIQQSADVCPHCEAPQVAEGPWQCKVCGHKANPPDNNECVQCGQLKGAVNPFSVDVLLNRSKENKKLSIKDLQIELYDGHMSDKFDMNVRDASLKEKDVHVPIVSFLDRSNKKIDAYIDIKHSLFSELHMPPHYAIAEIAADYIFSESVGIVPTQHQFQHNLASLTWRILDKYWKEDLADDVARIRSDVLTLLEYIQEKMAVNFQSVALDAYGLMSDEDIKSMVSKMQEYQVDLDNLRVMKESGAFFKYVPPAVIVDVFKNYTNLFFDGYVWSAQWVINELPEEVNRSQQNQRKQDYLNCIEDCVRFLSYRKPALVSIRRAKLSMEFLEKELVP